MRRSIHSICNDLNEFINNNDINVERLFGIFDDVAQEQYKLMNHSFRRFTKKPIWSKVVDILSRNLLQIQHKS